MKIEYAIKGVVLSESEMWKVHDAIERLSALNEFMSVLDVTLEEAEGLWYEVKRDMYEWNKDRYEAVRYAMENFIQYRMTELYGIHWTSAIHYTEDALELMKWEGMARDEAIKQVLEENGYELGKE